MDRQTTFADIEDASRKRATKREAFLDAMDAAIPWDELVAAVVPFYYPGKRGRRPIGAEKMLRMYFLQLWFSLSDEGVEDAVTTRGRSPNSWASGSGPETRSPTPPRC